MIQIDLSKFFVGIKNELGVYELIRATHFQQDVDWIRREQRERNSNSETQAKTSGQ